jgi:hypothetical protein
MLYETEFVEPSSGLKCLINHYLILKSEEKGVILKDEIIPDGFAGIVFNFKVEQSSI